jgi:hypothetical protein
MHSTASGTKLTVFHQFFIELCFGKKKFEKEGEIRGSVRLLRCGCQFLLNQTI